MNRASLAEAQKDESLSDGPSLARAPSQQSTSTMLASVTRLGLGILFQGHMALNRAKVIFRGENFVLTSHIRNFGRFLARALLKFSQIFLGPCFT